MSTLQVRVKGRPIDTYSHEGQTFVEGRKGSEYTLHYHNNSAFRRKIVLSVDGINVVTGDNTWDRGYVIEPWQSADIPGWRKDNQSVAAFEFSSIKGSYNQQNDSGEKKNIGVIGCLVFNEKPKYVPPTYVNHYHHYIPNYPYIWNGLGINNLQGTVAPPLGSGVNCDSSFTSTSSLGSGEVKTAMGINCSVGGSLNQQTTAFQGDAYKTSIKLAPLCADEPVFKNSVGTGYGEDKSFKTVDVNYEFYGTPTETLVVYYDDKQGLVTRGVIQRPKHHTHKAEAFPGFNPDGCPAPKRYKRKDKKHQFYS